MKKEEAGEKNEEEEKGQNRRKDGKNKMEM